jgi:ribosomal protein S1
VKSRLAKPAVEARLTYKDGKVVEVKVSSADGDNAYVSVKGHSEAFKVKKQMLEDLSFKAADLGS